MKIKLTKTDIIFLILFVLSINVAITSTIQRTKRPDLTETELFMLIPNNFMWNFLE